MRCPRCGHARTRVSDSRPLETTLAPRRRRRCVKCRFRFTTVETLEMNNTILGKEKFRNEPFPVKSLLRMINYWMEKAASYKEGTEWEELRSRAYDMADWWAGRLIRQRKEEL